MRWYDGIRMSPF